MNRFAVLIAVFGVGLAGCERQSNTGVPSQTDKPVRSDRKPGTDVDVDAPGVDVKVRGQDPDGKKDVDVKVRGRDKDDGK